MYDDFTFPIKRMKGATHESNNRPYDRYETDTGKGAALWRSIDLARERILELCDKKGINGNDTRRRTAIWMSDSKYIAARMDEDLGTAEAQQVLKDLRRDLLLHELTLRSEPFVTKDPDPFHAERRHQKLREQADVPVNEWLEEHGVHRPSAA